MNAEQLKGKFIAIEGPDGAGKSTQIKLLTSFFEQQGIETRFIHFPRTFGGIYGDMIARFLRGEYGQSADVHPELVSLLFAQDRLDFAPTLRQWQQEGYVVLVDRYVYSNIAYQCAKTTDSVAKIKLQQWILNLEFAYNKIPKPDLSFYLDVPFSFTQNALENKREGEERDYLQGKDDIHEKDLGLQQAVNKEYNNLLQSESDLIRIVCYDDKGKMKSPDEIHNNLLSYLR